MCGGCACRSVDGGTQECDRSAAARCRLRLAARFSWDAERMRYLPILLCVGLTLSCADRSDSDDSGAQGGLGATGGDPYGDARIRCVERTNALRATKGLAPIPRLASAEPCVD